ncbi:hypothetical protein JZ751_009725 [Albula glossodonta]|uniref:Mitochondrial assembly of ribosomal large subunit protein 1 n=1 Tax=Albula glossodonta TaxID=121402 RepID=A0A8T2P6F7_9TELE|nr:hypothetical protein JZ751_009725 [Albula glossodonta]
MALHSNMFVCSKRFLTKIFSFDVMNTNLRYLKNAQVNLDFHHSTNLQCRHTCFGSLSNRLFPTQSQAQDLRNSRFYTDIHRSTGDFNKNSLNTFEASTDSMDSETENDPRRRTSHVFNIDVLVALLRQENGADICVIKVPKEMRYTDYFVVVSGSSTRHLRAMAFYAVKVYKYLKQDSDPHVQIEGKDAEDWMCIDFGDIVVHFMLPEARQVYELEKLWTLRSFDEQLSSIPAETLPKDFIYEADLPK